MVEKRVIEDYFDRLLEQEKIPGQTFALLGPEGSGKRSFCRTLAERLLQSTKGDHPDLLIFRPQGKQALHAIQEMRRLSDEARRRPHLARYVVIIVEEADKMPLASSNALLKTFEEPSDSCLIFLISSRPERLLPTLLSRCTKIYFSTPISNDENPPFITLALDLLASPVKDFLTLKERIQSIVKAIEERPAKPKMPSQELTPQQRELFEKMEEGAESLQLAQDCQRLFAALLKATGPDRLPLIEGAALSLERQLPLQHALESLFLQLT